MKNKNIAFVLEKVLPFLLIFKLNIEVWMINSDGQVLCFLLNGAGQV